MSEENNLKVFTKQSLIEYAQENPSDTLVSIHENIYNVTPFLDEHPGGEETLKDHRIKTDFRDATESFEDTGHSMDARDMMKKFQIGYMENKKEKSKSVKPEQASVPKDNSSSMSWLLPAIIIAVVGLAYHFFTNRYKVE